MQEYEVTMDEYVKLYNETLNLYKIAKKEFNNIISNSFDKVKFEEIKSQLNDVHFKLIMCHYRITTQNATLSKKDINNLAKYYNLHTFINNLSRDYNNYQDLLDNASSKLLIENEEEMTIN